MTRRLIRLFAGMAVLAIPAAAVAREPPPLTAVNAHLDAVNDSNTPGCTGAPYPPFVNCNHIYYTGKGEYSGDLTGTVRYSGEANFSQTSGTYWFRESGTFTGSVRACGTGTFDYHGFGSLDGVEAAGGGFTGTAGAHWGAMGGGHGPYLLRPDGSIDADYRGYVSCRLEQPEVESRTRLLVGPTRGMRSARKDRPFQVSVRTVGGQLQRARVVVRDARGRRVGRSRPFSLGQRRKLVRVWVTRRLAAGRYRIFAAGDDATGRRVRAARSVRLRGST